MLNRQPSITAAEAMTAPLRILVAADVPPDPNAGASGTVFQMNAALRRMGHDVEEVWADEWGRRIQHGNLHYLLELPLAMRKALRRRLPRRTYDVVEFNQPHAYLAAREFRRRHAPGVFVNRSHGHEVRSEEVLQGWRNQLGIPAKRGVKRWVSDQIRWWLDRQWVQIARDADGFHVSSRDDGEFLQSRYGVPAQHIGVITQGIPPCFTESPRQPMTPTRLRKLLYVGQLAFFKAPMVLGKIVSELLLRDESLTMTWVCDPAHHPAARELVDSGVRQRVQLVPWMSQTELIDIYDQHGLFLFPSFFEGFGKAPLEAMARGCCVVASAHGGMRDYIDPAHNGRLVENGDVPGFVARAEEILHQPTLAEAMSTAAHETAKLHTWDRCAIDLTRFYRQLLLAKQAHEQV